MNQQSLIGNCIHCEGTVRVPTTASLDAQVKCPRCGEMFRLQEVLDKAAPELEIVEQPGKFSDDIPIVDRVLFETQDHDVPSIEVEETPKKFEVPAALRNGAKRKRRRRSRSRDSSSRDSSRGSSRSPSGSSSGSSSSRGGEHNRDRGDRPDQISSRSNGASGFDSALPPTENQPATNLPSITTDEDVEKQNQENKGTRGETRKRPATRPRRRKKQSSSMEAVKIMVGAMLAIPISQLLLWWFLNFDPLNAAPMVEKFIPALVPNELRAPRDDSPDSPNDAFNSRPPSDVDVSDPRRNLDDLDTPITDPTRLLRARQRDN